MYTGWHSSVSIIEVYRHSKQSFRPSSNVMYLISFGWGWWKKMEEVRFIKLTKCEYVHFRVTKINICRLRISKLRKQQMYNPVSENRHTCINCSYNKVNYQLISDWYSHNPNLHSFTTAAPRGTIIVMWRTILLHPERMGPVFDATIFICLNLVTKM